jgi:hypothetical protein
VLLLLEAEKENGQSRHEGHLADLRQLAAADALHESADGGHDA